MRFISLALFFVFRITTGFFFFGLLIWLLPFTALIDYVHYKKLSKIKKYHKKPRYFRFLKYYFVRLYTVWKNF